MMFNDYKQSVNIPENGNIDTSVIMRKGNLQNRWGWSHDLDPSVPQLIQKWQVTPSYFRIGNFENL